MFGIREFIVNDFKSVLSFSKLLRNESKNIYQNSSKGPKVFKFMILAVIGIIITHLCQHSGNSLSVNTLTYILMFDFLSLVVSALSIWIETQQRNSSDKFFGYKRYEVVAVFTSTVLTQISALFVIKESIERLFVPEPVSHLRLGIVAIIVLIIHLSIIFSVENRAFLKVIENSSSSWIQEHITDISESICHVIPSLSTLLLPRINPVNLLGSISAFIVLCVDLLISNEVASQNIDALGALTISIMIIATMTPMSVLSGRILLQTCPGYLIGELDKAIRQAGSIDGVLEIQKEHFWSLGFDEVVGSIHVRVRRDANEQLVLAHVANRLSPLVQRLTIQVFKDSWTRASNNMQYIKTKRDNPFTSIDLSNHNHNPKSSLEFPISQSHGHSHDHGHGHSH